MANSTQQKFDYPQSLIAETPYWSLQTRRQQPALGAVVLICKEPATAFGQLSAAAFAGLQGMIAAIERMLGGFVAYERINYPMPKIGRGRGGKEGARSGRSRGVAGS